MTLGPILGNSSGGGGAGDVVGPGAATDNAVALFDGATGKLLKNSVLTSVNTGAGSILDVNASATTTGFSLNIGNADALTTGAALRIKSNSADPTGRNVAFIRNQNVLAVGTTALTIQQDAANTALLISQTANGRGISIDSAATTFNALRFNTTAQTTAAIISIPNADSLTTGNALNFVSNSADASTRPLVFIRNQNAASVGTTGMFIQQDSTNNALRLDATVDGTALTINSGATTKPAISLVQTAQTTGNIINIPSADTLTSGSAINVNSNSASNTVRNLVNIRNQQPGATGTVALSVRQDAAQTAVSISQTANAVGLNVNTSATTQAAINVIADALTTGSTATFNSNSADATNRSIVNISNINAAATGASVLNISQNSTNFAINASRAAVNSTNAVLNISDAGTGSGTSLSINKTGASYGNGQGILSITRTGNITGVNGETVVDASINPNYTFTEPGAGSTNVYGLNIGMQNVAVTAGAGTSTVAALNLQAGTDVDAGTNLALLASGDSQFKGRILGSKANDIVAAGTLPAVTNANTVAVTGNTNIDFFPTVGWTSGSTMIFQFTGTPTVNHNTGAAPGGTANFQLAGAVGFVATAGDVLQVYFDGSSWRELGRSVI